MFPLKPFTFKEHTKELPVQNTTDHQFNKITASCNFPHTSKMHNCTFKYRGKSNERRDKKRHSDQKEAKKEK